MAKICLKEILYNRNNPISDLIIKDINIWCTIARGLTFLLLQAFSLFGIPELLQIKNYSETHVYSDSHQMTKRGHSLKKWGGFFYKGFYRDSPPKRTVLSMRFLITDIPHSSGLASTENMKFGMSRICVQTQRKPFDSAKPTAERRACAVFNFLAIKVIQYQRKSEVLPKEKVAFFCQGFSLSATNGLSLSFRLPAEYILYIVQYIL